MKKALWVVAVVVLAVLAGAARGQRASESVQVTVIEVPVTVVDRDGNPVRGLTRENFELFDEGKRVPVEYFEVLDLPKISEEPAEGGPLAPAARRHFLLMFDLANSSPGTIGRASEAAKEFVEKYLGPRDAAAVSTFTAESGAKMITNFTRNRQLLVDAIETLGHPSYFKVADPLMISAIRTAGADTSGPAGEGRGRAGVDAASAELAAEQQRLAQTVHDSEMRNRLRIQLHNMGNVARVLDRLHGQKQVILLSEGFDARLVQGREEMGAQSTAEESNAVLQGEVWKVDNEQRFGSTSSSRDISEMTELFRRSDVVLHAIDIKGLRGSGEVSGAASRKTYESLYLLTSPTGGTVFKNANDITENFGKMMKQQEVVYVLGFTARSTGKPGRFHTLKVRPSNVPGARVSHRAGYYEPTPQMTDLERNLTLAEILTADAPIEDVTVSVTPMTLPGPGGKARVPVVVEIPGPRLLEHVAGNNVNAQLYLYAFDDSDQVVDFLQQRIALDLAKAGEPVRNGGLRYYGTLRLPPGRHAVKALVRVDESGRIGFKRADVVVPPFDAATVMPPVLFSSPGNWAMLFAPSRGDDYAYPFAAGDEKYIPQREPSLQAGGEYKVALFLFRVPLEQLDIRPEIVAGSGSVLGANVQLLGRTAADERGGVKLLFTFKPEGLAAGDHELRFTVKPKAGGESVVTLPFTVM